MPINKELIFNMQAQLQGNWCWAANAASISHFYDTASTWSQCGIACNTLMRADCCLGGSPNPCDQPWYLDRALGTTGNFHAPTINNPLSENDMMGQIDSGCIIGVRIGWSGGGGHFVSIYGYNSTGTDFFVYVGDPIYGNSIVNLNNFTNNYQGSGSWTHSFLTKSIVGGMLQFTTINENLVRQANLLKESILLTNDGKAKPSTLEPKDFTIPHDVFTVSLNSLKEGNREIHKDGFRVVESGKKGKQKMYDYSDNGPNAKIQQIIEEHTFEQKYESVIERVFSSQSNNRDVFSLRTIRQPELKIEAFWVHSETHPERDTFIPIITSSILKANETYGESDFFKILENAAKNRSIYTDDLLGG